MLIVDEQARKQEICFFTDSSNTVVIDDVDSTYGARFSLAACVGFDRQTPRV